MAIRIDEYGHIIRDDDPTTYNLNDSVHSSGGNHSCAPDNNASSSVISENQTEKKKRAGWIFIGMCLLFVLFFGIYDVIKWKIRMTPTGYKSYSDVINLTWSHFPNQYIFAGTLEPDEADEYVITTKQNDITIDFIVHTSDYYYGVDLMLVDENGGYVSFNSTDSNQWIGDGYGIDIPKNGTYKLIVSSPYHVDYVVTLDGYIALVEGK